eukprot:scaffold27887_cov64-Cyclotella_meneghiniana.AAC.12
MMKGLDNDIDGTQRRHRSFSYCFRHARVLRVSILLLQLLCLPLCCLPANMDTGEDYLESEPKSSEYLDASLMSHRNLRHDRLTHSPRSISTYFSSFTSVLYALLGIRESQKDGNLEASTISFWSYNYSLEESDGIRETVEVNSHTLHEGNRKLQRQRKKSRNVDWVNALCVQSCDPRTTTNPNCAGLAVREHFLFDSATRCCKIMIPWKTYDQCTRLGSPDGTLNQVYDDLNPVNDEGNKVPPVNNVEKPNVPKDKPSLGDTFSQIEPSKNKPMPKDPDKPSMSEIFSQIKPSKGEPVPKDPGMNNMQTQTESKVPKTSCWRSGMSCASEAEKFACCGVCSNGLCT